MSIVSPSVLSPNLPQSSTLSIKRPDGAKKIGFTGEIKTPEGDQSFGADNETDAQLSQPSQDKVEFSKDIDAKKEQISLSDEIKEEIAKEVKKAITKQAEEKKPEIEQKPVENNSFKEKIANSQKTGAAVLGYVTGAIKSAILGTVAGGVTYGVVLARKSLKKKPVAPAKYWGIGVGAVTLGLGMAKTVLNVNADKAHIDHAWGVGTHKKD